MRGIGPLRRHRLERRVGLSLLVAAVIAGCSSTDDGGQASTDPGDATTTTDTTTAASTTVDRPVETDIDTTVPATTSPAGPTTIVTPPTTPSFPDAIPVVIDSDANNELDDQHALAYALFRPDLFDVIAITSNATRNGGAALAHTAEAERIVALTERTGSVPVVTGADGTFDEIRSQFADDDHDGREAVDTIIAAARAEPELVVVPIGKLTNVALAVAKAPDIADGLRVLWLGSNYPLGGAEYNLDNDPGALSFLLDAGVDAGVELEIAVVRPGEPTGTGAVQLTLEEASRRLPGLGPEIDPPVIGRTGGSFRDFGDYGAALFAAAEGFGDPPARSLYDLAAVAIVAEPAWANPVVFPAPRLIESTFVDQPDRNETIVVWERFDRDAIVEELFSTLQAVDE